jgi:predicted CXXCH cytochrome family protein
MRKNLILTVTGATLIGWLGFSAMGDIEGSQHDFSNSTWAGGEICKPCHTPHFANTDEGYLWAHTMSSQSYTLYDGTTTADGGGDRLDVYSRMCLSCHDGTIALNDFHNGTGSPVFISEGSRVGADGLLNDDHPIGLAAEYPIEGHGGLHAPNQSPSPSGVYGFDGGFFPEVPIFEFQTKQVVSCSSCHTPHAVSGVDNLLRKSNAGSDLCLTCHIK